MLVRVGDAFVVFLAIFVFVGVRIGITASPELFDETFPFIIRLQFFEGFALFVGDDIGDVFVEPVLVGLFQLRLLVAGLIHRILIGLVLLLREARGNGKTKGQESDSQTARSAF